MFKYILRDELVRDVNKLCEEIPMALTKKTPFTRRIFLLSMKSQILSRKRVTQQLGSQENDCETSRDGIS